jgi:hypothetical protein
MGDGMGRGVWCGAEGEELWRDKSHASG